MLHIEVSEKTFKAVINTNVGCSKVESHEHFRKIYFYNKDFDQRGFIVENFTSFVHQYYLIDINE